MGLGLIGGRTAPQPLADVPVAGTMYCGWPWPWVTVRATFTPPTTFGGDLHLAVRTYLLSIALSGVVLAVASWPLRRHAGLRAWYARHFAAVFAFLGAGFACWRRLVTFSL